MFLVSSCNCLCPIHWSEVLSWEWQFSWSSADRRYSNYIWVINNFIAYWGVAYIRSLTVVEIELGDYYHYSGFLIKWNSLWAYVAGISSVFQRSLPVPYTALMPGYLPAVRAVQGLSGKSVECYSTQHEFQWYLCWEKLVTLVLPVI